MKRVATAASLAASLLVLPSLRCSAAATESVLYYSFCALENCADGETSSANPLEANGALYGTTLAGDAFGGGAVFALNPNTGAETVIESFG